jgi:hypothetical protein
MVNIMENYCSSCGTQIVQGASFCLKCGKKIELQPSPNITPNKPNFDHQTQANQYPQYQQQSGPTHREYEPTSNQFMDIFAIGTLDHIQQVTQNVFTQHGFKIDWYDQFSGKAHKGSKGANFAFGTLAQYFEIDFQLSVLPTKAIRLRLIKTHSGWMGGLLGMARVNKRYAEISNMFISSFQSMGVYQGSQGV